LTISSSNPMDPRPLVFLDSGIGSLPYYKHFASRNPGEQVYCIADRANFPYGNKSREELQGLLRVLLGRILRRFNPKLLALACNTASVSALASLREEFSGIPIVGTVPAVKPAVERSRTRRVGVIGTERAMEDPYMREIAARYGPDCLLLGEAAPDLVGFVERRYWEAGPEESLTAVRPWVERFRRAGADGLVLGCTHFLLLLEEFRAAAAAAGGNLRIYDSLEGITRRIESFLEGPGLPGKESPGGLSPPVKPAAKPAAAPRGERKRAVLVITGPGEVEPRWRSWAGRFGLDLERWP